MFQITRKIKSKISVSVIHLITDHRLLITVILPLSLTGCMGIYEGGFECPPGKGVGCKSISDVNQMVDQGDLPEKSLVDLPQSRCKKCGANQNQERDPEHSEKPEKAEIWYSAWGLEKA